MWVTYHTHASILADGDNGILAPVGCPTGAEPSHHPGVRGYFEEMVITPRDES